MTARRLLIVEDEDVIRRALTRFLERRGFAVTGAATVAAAARGPLDGFDVVLVDLRLPDAPGTELIGLANPVPVVVMTSHASVRSAVEAMRRGAADYVAKPFDHDELLLVLERAMRHHRLDAENRALRRELERGRALHRRLADTSLERLVDALVASLADRAGGRPEARPPRLFAHGEPGSAREGVARGLHERLRGAGSPFAVVDVPTLDASERAASRVALRAREARHGTLALRHPELLDADARARLVDACAEADALLVAIGVRAPDACLADGALDAGFVAGLDLVFEVPPLRRRRDDAATLARRAVAEVAARRARPALALAPDADAWLRARDWPGNVPELDQTVQRAAALAAGDVVSAAALAAAAAAGTGSASVGSADAGPADAISPDTVPTVPAHAPSLDEYFRWFVLTHQASLSETALAARLGISRKALWERRRRDGLPRRTDPRGSDPDPDPGSDPDPDPAP